MQITIAEIKAFSRCPRQYSFMKNAGVAFSIANHSAIKDIIKQCYINRSQHGYDPQWETIKSRINKHCFGPIDITKKDTFAEAYRLSIEMMGVLHYWYYKVFQNDTRHGITNIPLTVEIGKSIITGSVDLILIDKSGPVPLIFSDGRVASELHNDIEFKTILWMIARETGMNPKQVEYATVTTDSVKYQKVFNRTSENTMEQYINYIVCGIENRMFFPSVTEHCNNCTWKDICTI